MTLHYYRYFNRTISSEYPLELPIDNDSSTTWIHIRTNELADKLTSVGAQLSIWGKESIGATIQIHQIDAYGYLLTFFDRYRFGISNDGSEILIEKDARSGYANTAHLLTNQVLPMTASLHGKQVLHASAVEINGEALVFIGESGFGKSTLATALAQMGGALIGDDSLILEQIGGVWHVTANYPSLRLWPDNAQRLLKKKDVQGKSVSTYCNKKNFFNSSDNPVPVRDKPAPIRNIYVLDAPENSIGAKHISVEKLQPGVGLKKLLESLFRLDVSEKERVKKEFLTLSQLLKTVDVSKLSYPRAYTKLDFVCKELMQTY